MKTKDFGELTLNDIVYCTDCENRYEELSVRSISADDTGYNEVEIKLSGMDKIKFPRRESKFREKELSFTTDAELWKEWIRKIVKKDIEEQEHAIASHKKQLENLQSLLIKSNEE